MTAYRARSSFRLLNFLLPLTCLLWLAAPPSGRAQNADYQAWLESRSQSMLENARQRDEGNSAVGHERINQVREDLEAQKRAVEREKSYSYPEPVLSPDGKPLAAIVNDRYMTLEDLNSRIRSVLQGAKPLEHPDADTRRIMNENRVLGVARDLLEDWVMNNMLSLQGQALGFKATEAEVDEAMKKLRESQAELASEGAIAPGGTMLGMPESRLRAEIRDSVIIEKYINSLIDAQYKREDYDRIYRIDPASFRIPDRVRAFHIFQPIERRGDAKAIKAAEKNLDRLRRALRKASPEEMAKLAADSKDQNWTAGDMGWVTSHNTTISPVLLRGLFGLPVGETSPVFQTPEGVHVIRILERENGSAPGLDSAIPQIKNYLFTKTKYATFEVFKPVYDIRTNTGGIKRWRSISPDEFKRRTATGAPPEPKGGITIAQLRKEIEAERRARIEAGGSALAPAPEPSRSSEGRTSSDDVLDLGILE